MVLEEMTVCLKRTLGMVFGAASILSANVGTGSPSLPAVTEATFKVTFRVYGIHPGEYENIGFFSADKTTFQKPEFNAKRRSEHFSATLLKADPWLRFYRRPETTLSPSASIVPAIVGTVRLSPEMKEVLLVFVPNRTHPSAPPFFIYPTPDDTNAFPRGSLSVLNVSGADILGTLDQTKIQLEHGACGPTVKVARNGETSVLLERRMSSRYHTAYKHRLKTGRDERLLLILLPPSRKGSYRVNGLVLTEYLGNRNQRPENLRPPSTG